MNTRSLRSLVKKFLHRSRRIPIKMAGRGVSRHTIVTNAPRYTPSKSYSSHVVDFARKHERDLNTVLTVASTAKLAYEAYKFAKKMKRRLIHR